MINIKNEMSGQPMEIAIGPPLFQACPNVVKHPLSIEITENEMAKLENPDQLGLVPVYSQVRPGGVHLLKCCYHALQFLVLVLVASSKLWKMKQFLKWMIPALRHKP